MRQQINKQVYKKPTNIQIKNEPANKHTNKYIKKTRTFK